MAIPTHVILEKQRIRHSRKGKWVRAQMPVVRMYRRPSVINVLDVCSTADRGSAVLAHHQSAMGLSSRWLGPSGWWNWGRPPPPDPMKILLQLGQPNMGVFISLLGVRGQILPSSEETPVNAAGPIGCSNSHFGTTAPLGMPGSSGLGCRWLTAQSYPWDTPALSPHTWATYWRNDSLANVEISIMNAGKSNWKNAAPVWQLLWWTGQSNVNLQETRGKGRGKGNLISCTPCPSHLLWQIIGLRLQLAAKTTFDRTPFPV